VVGIVTALLTPRRTHLHRIGFAATKNAGFPRSHSAVLSRRVHDTPGISYEISMEEQNARSTAN